MVPPYYYVSTKLYGVTPRMIVILTLPDGRRATFRRLPSSGMLRRVAFVRTDVSEECIIIIIRVKRIGELGTTLEVTSNQSTLRRRFVSPR
jgi:hypothetical protein